MTQLQAQPTKRGTACEKHCTTGNARGSLCHIEKIVNVMATVTRSHNHEYTGAMLRLTVYRYDQGTTDALCASHMRVHTDSR